MEEIEILSPVVRKLIRNFLGVNKMLVMNYHYELIHGFHRSYRFRPHAGLISDLSKSTLSQNRTYDRIANNARLTISEKPVI